MQFITLTSDKVCYLTAGALAMGNEGAEEKLDLKLTEKGNASN